MKSLRWLMFQACLREASEEYVYEGGEIPWSVGRGYCEFPLMCRVGGEADQGAGTWKAAQHGGRSGHRAWEPVRLPCGPQCGGAESGHSPGHLVGSRFMGTYTCRLWPLSLFSGRPCGW